MAEQAASDMLANATKYWKTLDAGIQAEAEKGNLNTLDVTIESAIHATIARCISSPDPPALLDFDLHSFWSTLFRAAQSFHADNPKQDTLLRHVLCAQQCGVVVRRGMGTEHSLACTSNGQRIWIDLPYFVQDFHEMWSRDFKTMSTEQRRNLSAFLARLASVGVCGNVFAGFALLTFRDALETPERRWSGAGDEPPIGALLPALNSWLVYAPHKLKVLVKEAFSGFESSQVASVGELARRAGVSGPGFSPSRWSFWKERLGELKVSEATDETSSVLRMMEDLDADDMPVD